MLQSPTTATTAPVVENSSDGVPLAQPLREESQQLQRILLSARRGATFRHHRWFRQAQSAAAAIAHPAILKVRATAREKRVGALKCAHTRCIRAAQAAAAECGCSRIDTVAVSLALLACLARLSCLVGRLLVRLEGEGALASRFGTAYVAKLRGARSAGGKRPRGS